MNEYFPSTFTTDDEVDLVLHFSQDSQDFLCPANVDSFLRASAW